MKIVLLAGHSRLHRNFASDVFRVLNPDPETEVSLVTWRGTRNPLEFAPHFIAGPHLRWYGKTEKAKTLPRNLSITNSSNDTSSPGDSSEYDLNEFTDPSNETVNLPSEVPVSSSFYKRAQQRVRKALAWRINRIRRNPTFRNWRAKLTPPIGFSFGFNCVTQADLRSHLKNSDLIIAVDTKAQSAAWIISRKISGPTILSGVSAAKNYLENRQLS